MNIDLAHMRTRRGVSLATLFCTTSFLTLAALTAASGPALAADTATATMPPPEEVIVTGSLISGAQAVGVPVTDVGPKDFQDTGATTVADVLRSVPSIYVQPTLSPNAQGGDQTRENSVDIHQMNVAGGLRTLMLIDGMRYSLEREIANVYDPSIIPPLALERVDVLADGASATYGSDAVAGVVNLILRRGYDGAITQFNVSTEDGAFNWQGSQLFGRTWDGGDLTVTFQHSETGAINGSALPFYTQNFIPYGYDNETLFDSSFPGIVSTGSPVNGASKVTVGTACTNCYSVPKGTGFNFGANGTELTSTPTPTTNWTTLLANQGILNQVNPYSIAQISNASQSNGFAATFDQKILPWLSLFGEGFYTNRRTSLLYPAVITPYNKLQLVTTSVPTLNPYYPTGAPANLLVSYDFAKELPPVSSGFETSGRYAGGFNVDLPFDWHGKVFGSINEESTYYDQQNSLNTNNISAALGLTVPAIAGTGVTPGTQAFTKPANIPYLNLFCDPNAFQCNSPATLAYISGYAQNPLHYIVNQYGATFDGPLFALPGGEVKGAIGTSYSTDTFFFESIRTRSPDSPNSSIVVTVPSTSSRQQWAAFGQINVPIFGDDNAVPGFRKLELEISGRYDQYSDFGGTWNPKIGVNWEPVEDLQLRGSWGTSFRAPLLENLSPVAARTVTQVNGTGGTSEPACPSTTGGSAGAVSGTVGQLLNPMCTAGAANTPVGIDIAGGSGGLNGITRPLNFAMQPEKGNNLNLGFDYTPHDFLKGLDFSMTWYQVNITNVITSLALTGVPNALSNPSFIPVIIAPGVKGETQTQFTAAVAAALAIPQSSVAASQLTNIQFIVDSASTNLGTFYQDGFDFSLEYDWDMGNWGTGNAGITGDYKLHQITTVPGGSPVDAYATLTPFDGIQPLAFQFTNRSHIGWSLNGISATLFMDYTSAVASTNASPPGVAAGSFSDKVPAEFLFDVSLGYNTGDTPANDYLKDLNFQLVINNFLNRQPPFAYNLAASGAVAYLPSLYSPYGRIVSFTITKTW